MATTTETKNGVQTAADESARATIRAWDALSDYYLAAFDAGLKFQARAIETTKLLLDETAAFQRANRKLIDELLQTSRKSQQELQKAVDANVRASQVAWAAVSPEKR